MIYAFFLWSCPSQIILINRYLLFRDLNESINLDTDDTNSSEPNLESTNKTESNIDDSAANLSTSVVEDSPIFIEDDGDDEDDEDEVDEVDLNTRLSRLRPRSGGRVLPSRGRKKTKKTKTKQSPNKKKKIIEYDFSLLEDNDDSLVSTAEDFSRSPQLPLSS